MEELRKTIADLNRANRNKSGEADRIRAASDVENEVWGLRSITNNLTVTRRICWNSRWSDAGDWRQPALASLMKVSTTWQTCSP